MPKLLTAFILAALASTNALAADANFAGFWCNSDSMLLKAGNKQTNCPANTVGLSLDQTGTYFQSLGVELLCGDDVQPIFQPFQLGISGGNLFNGASQVGTLDSSSATFTINYAAFTTTQYAFRSDSAGALFYNESTYGVSGNVINRNQGNFRLMPAGTRTCR